MSNDDISPIPEATGEFMRAAGLHLDEVGPTSVTGWIDLDAAHHQPWGLVHGGVSPAAIETAASVGASTAARKLDLVAVGVNNNTNFVRSMVAGRVAVHAVAISAGDQAEAIAARHGGEHSTRAGNQFRAKRGIMLAPRGVGGVPRGFAQTGGAGHVLPVGRMMFRELVEAPRAAQPTETG